MATFVTIACVACTKPNSHEGKTSQPAAPTEATVGDRPAAFSLPSYTTSANATVVAGKVMVVQFWATWNGPCKHSFPKLQELYAKYAPRGFEIAALSVDDDGGTESTMNGGKTSFIGDAAREWGAKFPVAWDRGHEVADRWRPTTVPTIYVIDRGGRVRFIHHGWHDGEERDLEQEIGRLVE
jgi:thiol-disulfide isomerase/thioredoxin